MEGEGREHRADDEGAEALVGGDGRQRRDDAGAVLGGAGDGRAGAAEVGDRAVADADQEHQAHVVVALRAADRDGGHLTGAAGAARRLEGGEEVDAEGLGRLVGAGAEQRAVRVGKDREGPHLGAADLVRQRGAEGELGR